MALMMADWTAVERCRKPSGWGKRHVVAGLGFWGFALAYALRFSLSIAIVAMVNQTGLPSHQKMAKDYGEVILFKSDVCPHDKTPHETIDLKLNLFHVQTIINNELSVNYSFKAEVDKGSGGSSVSHANESQNPVNDGVAEEEEPGEFAWDEEDQGLILGSFFWGYVLTQIPGGLISQKFGGKWPFAIGSLITGLFALLTPVAARLGGLSCIILLRFVQGVAGGVTFPAMQPILASWFPPEERGKLGAFAYAGMPFGVFLSTLSSGYLIHYFGWPSVFYSTGALTVVWFFLWCLYVHETPYDDPTISKQELNYIQISLGHRYPRDGCNSARAKRQVPWTKALLSAPFWAIIICNTCETWGLYTIMTELPTYMKTVLHFDIKQNSVMSAFPHLLTLIVSLALTTLGDKLIERDCLSIGTVRKLCTTIALWGSSAALLGVAYSGCDRVKTVALLGTAIAVLGGKFGGVLVNIIDIAPNYAGILMGIINTAASSPGFFAPWVAGIIINEDPSLENWRLVFLITAAIGFVGNLVYILFASGEKQSWNEWDDGDAVGDKGVGGGTSLKLECINHVILAERIGEKDKEIQNGVFIIPPNMAEANGQPQQQQLAPGINLGEEQHQQQGEITGHRCSA